MRRAHGGETAVSEAAGLESNWHASVLRWARLEIPSEAAEARDNERDNAHESVTKGV